MSTFLRLLGFLRPYRRSVIWSLLLALGAMAMTVALPLLTGQAVNAISDRDGENSLRLLALAVVGAGLIRLGLSVARRVVAGKVSLGIEYDLRQRLYGHLQKLELGFFEGQQTGQLMSRATVDLQSVRFFLGYGLVFVVQSALTILLSAIAMGILQPKLAAISLLPVPIVVYVARAYGRRSRPALQEVQQRIAELTAEAEENISGVRVVKAFAAEERQLERFRHATTRVFSQAMFATKLQAMFNPLIAFLPNMGLAAILLIGGRDVIAGRLTIGAFVAFYAYLLMLIGPMRTLGVMLGMAQRATASGARIFEILDREPALTSPEGAPPPPQGGGRLEFKSVSLSYSGSNRPALSGINLTVDAGRTVAIVGPSGSGKSSLASLVPRLYDPQSGTVSLDGADVKTLDLPSLRQSVAIVGDDPFLFSATVHDNIAYGQPNATREVVVRAAEQAQASRFIDSLPDGYDTRIGERGLTLSGGQRQRIAIARAIVADPRVLILDDATSSVDATTEREIKRALQSVMEGRTTLIVAHRLSTIALADEIAVLDAGKLIDHGTHSELLDRSDLYRRIVEKGLPDNVFLNRKPAESEAGGL
ncbi:MAG: ABC transporter ATP-binding protein [Solirubrobacterales bacterium]|nr:ABC transporter ATP-binding protein [Solirubrobacterales bacterium]